MAKRTITSLPVPKCSASLCILVHQNGHESNGDECIINKWTLLIEKKNLKQACTRIVTVDQCCRSLRTHVFFTYFWKGTNSYSPPLGIKKPSTWDCPQYFLFFVCSWSRESTPFTALNVGRRGWRSCPCPTLRLLLWEVKAPSSSHPLVGLVSKYLCFRHPHRALAVSFSWYKHVCRIALWPIENVFSCLLSLLSASRWQQREWKWFWWPVQRWVIPVSMKLNFLSVRYLCLSSLCQLVNSSL